jgi:hypothetical protein
MRLRAIRLGVLAAVSGLVLACGGDDSSGGGGSSAGRAANGGGAGSAGSGSGATCTALKPCGGDPIGNWTVEDLCVKEPQKLFAAALNQPACSAALKSTKNIVGTGMYQLGADKNATSTISVSGTAEFSFNDGCVKALAIAQSAASECSKVEAEFKKQSAVKSAVCAAAGGNCDCTIMSDLSFAGNGSYTVSNNQIMISGLTQPFCVAGNTLTVESMQAGSTLTFTLKK